MCDASVTQTVSHVLTRCHNIINDPRIIEIWSNILDVIKRIFTTNDTVLLNHFGNEIYKSQFIINPFSLNNPKFRVDVRKSEFYFLLEHTQDYLMFVFDKLKKFQKRRNADPSRQRYKKGGPMEKDHDPRGKKSRQHPGKKHPKRDQNQPPLTQFFPKLNSNKALMNFPSPTQKIEISSVKIKFFPPKKINIQLLIYTSLQTCDSKPLIPPPRPP